MGELLACAFGDAPAALGRLIEIAEALPYPSVALAQAGLAVSLRIRAELPPGTGTQTIARWALRAGTMYAQAGRPAEALQVTEKAVAIRGSWPPPCPTGTAPTSPPC